MDSFLEVKETDIWVTNFFLDLSGSNNHVNCAMLFPATISVVQLCVCLRWILCSFWFDGWNLQSGTGHDGVLLDSV